MKLGYQTSLQFNVSQHIRDQLLLTSFKDYFKCGIIVNYENHITYKITSFKEISGIIITFFNNYPSTKLLNFTYFCKVSLMMENK